MKIGKVDVKKALKAVMSDELKKQKEADMKKLYEKFASESYTDNCPYCGKLTTVSGDTVEINNKKYIKGKCQKCGKDIYVNVVITPPASILGEPETYGYFFKYDDIITKDIQKKEDNKHIVFAFKKF